MFSPFVYPAVRKKKKKEASRKRQLYFGSQWSLCQVRHTSVVWQPAELCEPRALWARHWITGLRSSGSLSVQYSTVLLGDLRSHRLALFRCLSRLSGPPPPTSLHISPASFWIKAVDFWWRSRLKDQPTVGGTLPRLVANCWFLSFSCCTLSSSQLVSVTYSSRWTSWGLRKTSEITQNMSRVKAASWKKMDFNR